MSTISLPSSMRFENVSMGQVRYDTEEMSDSNGSSAARLGAPPRWALSLSSGAYLSPTETAAWKAMLLGLRGKVNVLAAHNPMQTFPNGTMRGTLTLSANAAAGAVSVSVTGGGGQASTTLLTGDFIQLGTGLGTSQLVMVMADATANGSGVIALTVEPPLRIAFSSGAAVAWDHPLAYYRMQTETTRWTYNLALAAKEGGFAVDFMETFG